MIREKINGEKNRYLWKQMAFKGLFPNILAHIILRVPENKAKIMFSIYFKKKITYLGVFVLSLASYYFLNHSICSEI